MVGYYERKDICKTKKKTERRKKNEKKRKRKKKRRRGRRIGRLKRIMMLQFVYRVIVTTPSVAIGITLRLYRR